MTKKFIRIGIVLSLVSILIWSLGTGGLFKSKTAYAVGDLMVDWGVPEGNPIFTIAGGSPGQVENRNVLVTNSTSDLKQVALRGILTSETASLSGALKISIEEGAATLYGPKTLAQFFDDSNSSNGIPLSDLPANGATTYVVTLSFDENAGNEFQNASIVFDLKIGVGFVFPAECGDISQFGTPILGGAGNDHLAGGNKKDLIVGFEGNDTIDGGNGDDCIIGGAGNNRLQGGNGSDVITAADGNDKIDGGNDADLILAGDGINKVQGGNGDDEITAGSGDDQLDGGNGADTIHAGGGNDLILGINGGDSLFGEEGIDKANGGNGNDFCEAETRIKCEM